MNISIRPLAPDDELEPLVALDRVCFSNPWTREMFRGELANPAVSAVYVAHDPKGDLVAFCSVWLILDELHINHIGVSPAHRRQGLATTVLRRVVGDAVARGARRATLEVRRSNDAALGLYERLGFAVRSVRPRYYENPVEDALILWHESLGQVPGDAEA